MALNIDYIGRETANNLRRNLTLAIATLLTVVVSLSLVGISLLVRQATTNASGRFRGDIELIVFMQPQATDSQIAAVDKALDGNPEVRDHSFTDKDAAYQEFLKLFPDDKVMRDVTTPEILPTSFTVVPINPDFQSVSALRQNFETQPAVREVVSADDTIKALQKVTGKINRYVFIAAGVLLLSALMLIFNTIRTAMFARRREIEVMKLVGATNWFIRIPFILEGLIQGVLGGALAAGVLLIYNSFLTTDLASANETNFFSNFVVSTPDVVNSGLVVLVIGALIGGLGSGLAAGRFLDV